MKIVIAGGGTAGWLAALILSKRNPTHEYVVVESSTIGIVGAGEGSTGTLTNIIQNLTFDYGCNESEFVKMCDVTPKLGIEFVNWTGDCTSYISPISGSYSSHQPVDHGFAYTYSKFGLSGLHFCSEDGLLIEENKDTLSIDNGPAAYHFDAHKVGKYFKKVCGDKVLNIDAEIQDVKIDELGNIASLTLNNGTEVIGDFFIDATGFKKILMNKLHGQWKSYKKYLPVDRAMPFLTKYKPSEIIKPVTTARALDNGWLWQIPLLHRKGCGYVYSSEYTSDSAAQSELENLLGEKIDPIRVINFESGRQEELWIKNCMSIGLAAAFAEPLEATSIHTTIVQLENFAEYCLSETIEDTSNPALAKLYNSQMAFMYDLLKDFLVLHYQGNRTDTNFWKYITAGNTLTDFTKEILELAKIRMLNSAMFPQIAGAAGWPLWSFILAGTGNLTQETVKKDLLLNRIPEFSSQEFTKFKFYMENKNFYLQDNNDQIRKRQRQI